MPPIGTTPTWALHGSKANLAKWIVSILPDNINTFIEPFAGRGNITYRLKTTPKKFVNKYILNDLYNYHWFKAIQNYTGDWSFLEPEITNEIYRKWRNSPDSIERDLMEPIANYQGNNWNMNSANNYSLGSRYGSPNFKSNLERKYKLTQNLLKNCETYGYNYKELFDHIKISSGDVVYFDPPYLSPYDEKRTYPNINHNEFLDFVFTLKCKVFISGYESELYFDRLKNCKCHVKERYSTAKQRQGTEGKEIKKVEYLWEVN